MVRKKITVEQLREKYPELVAEIEQAARSGAEASAEASAKAAAADLKAPGFYLDQDDPFAEGAARVYAAAKKVDTPRLPIVLPFKDTASKAALESYIQRAAGGGRADLAKAAAEALEKCK